MESTVKTDLPPGVHTVELAISDAQGVLRGKSIPASQWERVATNGFHMASVLYSWTPGCDIRDDDEVNRPELGWPDMHVKPMLETLREVPWNPGTALCLCETELADGSPIGYDPRQVLKKVLDEAREFGLEISIGFEIEFYLYDAQTRRPHYSDIQCYGIGRGAQLDFVLAPMRNQLVEFGIPIEASNPEFAPGQVEVNIMYGEALETADNAVLFKNGVRAIADRHGCIASFMAKPSADTSGSGLHLHHSAVKDGKNAFSDGSGRLNELGRNYLGGLQAHMAEIMLFGSPTPNSFKRQQDYSFCPTTATWGYDNRTTALRVIEGSCNAVRIEQRDGSADANPYLIMAAQIAAGLHGIREGLEPGPATKGDAYADPDATKLPSRVPDAVHLLIDSSFARKSLGDEIVDLTCGTALHEHRLIHGHVSDFERDRYREAF